jgi:homoserine kinase type II
MRGFMGTFRTLTDADLEEIIGGFGLSGLRSFTPIAAGTINTNVALELEEGRRFLRINEGKSEEDVAREAAIVEFLSDRGLNTPRPLRSAAGQPWLSWRGVQVSLFPWVEGRTLTRAELGETQAHQAGVALARLHLTGAPYPDHRPGRYEPDEIARRLDEIEARAAEDPGLAAAVAELRPELRRLARERAAVESEVPHGLIHGDLFIDNVLYRGANLVALLDFEQAAWGRPVYDLAVSVLAFGFGLEDFRPEITRAFIDGYVDTRPAEPIEARVFGDELCFAACRFTVTRITDVYLRRELGAPPGKDFRRYLQRLRAVKLHLEQDDGLLSLAGP